MSEDVVSVIKGALENPEYKALMWRCVGCGEVHVCQVDGPMMSVVWVWCDSLTTPTLAPSIMERIEGGKICHFYVSKGVVQFLRDCTHELAGKLVQMLPENARPFDEKPVRPHPPHPVG